MTPQEEIIEGYRIKWGLKPTTRVWWTSLVNECFEISKREERQRIKEEVERIVPMAKAEDGNKIIDELIERKKVLSILEGEK